MNPQQSPFIVRWIIGKGLATNEQGAYKVILLGTLVFLFILWLLWPSHGPQVSKEEQARQRQDMERMLPGSQQQSSS